MAVAGELPPISCLQRISLPRAQPRRLGSNCLCPWTTPPTKLQATVLLPRIQALRLGQTRPDCHSQANCLSHETLHASDSIVVMARVRRTRNLVSTCPCPFCPHQTCINLSTCCSAPACSGLPAPMQTGHPCCFSSSHLVIYQKGLHSHFWKTCPMGKKP